VWLVRDLPLGSFRIAIASGGAIEHDKVLTACNIRAGSIVFVALNVPANATGGGRDNYLTSTLHPQLQLVEQEECLVGNEARSLS
jgi:hypothetical protein